MDARLIPTVFPVAKKVVQLSKFKDELERYENSGEEGKMIERYKQRLRENIQKLEKELGYESRDTSPSSLPEG